MLPVLLFYKQLSTCNTLFNTLRAVRKRVTNTTPTFISLREHPVFSALVSSFKTRAGKTGCSRRLTFMCGAKEFESRVTKFNKLNLQ